MVYPNKRQSSWHLTGWPNELSLYSSFPLKADWVQETVQPGLVNTAASSLFPDPAAGLLAQQQSIVFIINLLVPATLVIVIRSFKYQ